MVADLVEDLVDDADSLAIERYEVHHRVARGTKGQIFIDLSNDEREVLVVDANGYRIHDFVDEIPLFFRSPGMMALANPVGHVGNMSLLRGFLPVLSEGEWRLLVVYILFSLRPNGPYVILVLTGGAGSTKSTFSRLLRRLIDPSSASASFMRKSSDDLIITATKSHLVVFDNVRVLTYEISDMLCCLATGASIRKRKLFTDSEESLLRAIKPCVLNGISDFVTQPDLISRCIQLDLPEIKIVRTEEEFNASFEASISTIFAGVMDALSGALAALPGVQDTQTVRMADFARFGTAVERDQKWPVGSFMEAYAENQRYQMSNVVGDNPLAQAVRALVSSDVEDGISFAKTPTAMLDALNEFPTRAQAASTAWPKSPHSLTKSLKKIVPALRACGVGVEFARSGIRTITLSRLEGFDKE